ncbi:MAG: protein kinase domain-containing protein [Planctomycetota bacterium]|jgi:serine/threonine-protein kinase
MSPEQARGKPSDKRGDIWSFGCVLYEMLTGRIPFRGETISDTLANILQTEPNWQVLPESTPANIRSLLRRCLEKDPRRRLRDIGDASIEIRETVNLPVLASPMTTSSAGISPRLTNWKQMITFGAVCLVLGVVLTGIVFRSRKRPVVTAGPPMWTFPITPETELADEVWVSHVLAFSPDGKFLAYVEKGTDKRKIICVRESSEIKAKELYGTAGASSVFFSPDGERIGYFDGFEKKLKKVSVRSGEPMFVCDLNDFSGASWGADDIIVVSRGKTGLWSIPASGKGLKRLTTPDPNRGESAHRWPQILPDGKQILFTIAREGGLDEYECGVYSFDTHTVTLLDIKGGSNARYLPTGHIVYARKETLYAVRFDLERLSTAGPHSPVIRNVAGSGNRLSHFTIADNGSLAYIPVPGPTQLRPVLVTKEGRTQPVSTTLRDYHSISISPYGTRVAFDVWESSPAGIWIYDVEQKTMVHFTSDGSRKCPIWAPDGKHIIFMSGPERLRLLYRQKADGSGKAELLANITVRRLTSCHPDGKQLLVTRADSDSGNDIWVVPIEEESQQSPFPFIQSGQGQQQAVWSSDGQWVAYSSNESGVAEIYVAPYPGPGPRIRISTQGGQEPVWSRNSKELYYRSDDKMIAATFETEPEFKVTGIRTVFPDPFVSCKMCKTYDVGPDGEFVMIQDTKEPLQQINVVVHWFEELKRLVPTGKD